MLTVAFLVFPFYPIFQGEIVPEAHATNVNFSLVANVNGWNYTRPSGTNPTIVVHDTDNVFFSFTASDTQQHQFYIDVDKDGVAFCNGRDECSGLFNSTTPTNSGWSSGVIPAGTYHYYDNLHPATTNGTFVVQPGPYPSTAKILLVGTTNGWNYSQPSGTNPTITVRYDQNVFLNFTTTDTPSIQHRLYIDIDKNGVPDCSGIDYCDLPFNSTSYAQSYWGAGFLPAGTYHYYDTYYPSVSNGTFIILAPTSDYYVSSNPSAITIQQGRSQSSTVFVSSSNNYTGTISLSANPSGVTATLNPTSVSVPKNGIVTSTLNITAPASLSPGNYPIVVTASNGTTQRSTTVYAQVAAPDFSIMANTNALSVLQGSSTTSTVTTTSLNGFSGNVSLKDQITPSGPSASQNPIMVSVGTGGSQTSILTISTSVATPAGTYIVDVTGNATGSNGPVTHTVPITLTVTAPPSTTPRSPSFPTFLYEALAAIIVLSLLIILVRKRSTSQNDQMSTDSHR